jgi:hypothetical protein
MLIFSLGDYVAVTFWTTVEVYVSVILPSLPAIRSMLSQKFSMVFGIETGSRTKHQYEQSQSKPPIQGDSFKMVSIGTKNNERDAENSDFFHNSNMNLGGKVKGTVHTGVVGGILNDSGEMLVREESTNGPLK